MKPDDHCSVLLAKDGNDLRNRHFRMHGYGFILAWAENDTILAYFNVSGKYAM